MLLGKLAPIWLALVGSIAAAAVEGAGVGDEIILTPWDRLRGCEGILSVEDAAAGMKACGLNVAGFVRPEDLDLCHKQGLKAIVSDRRVSGYDWRHIDPELVERNIRELVAEVGTHPAVYGYYVKDEPSAEEFVGLAVVVKALAKHAPGKLAYINLFPDYATINNPDRVGQLGTDSYQEYLERFIATVPTPVVSYDNYSIEKEYSVRPSYFRNLLSVRAAALANERIFWNVVTSNQVRPFRGAPTPASLAFQVNTTLAAGGRGIAYYTYYTGDKSVPGSGGYSEGPLWNFRPTPVWGYLKDTHEPVRPLLPVLARLTSTGVYFGPTAPVDGLPLLPGKVIASVASERPLMVGEFRDAGSIAYAMLVNLDLLRATDVTWVAREGFGQAGRCPTDGAPAPLRKLHLEPGGAALMMFPRR